MVKVGFIGYGSMGSMLINGFISSRALKEEDIAVSTKTREKLNDIKLKWENINIAKDNIELAKKSEYIFICVKPLEVKKILIEIKDYLNNNSHLISIAGNVAINNLEKFFNGKISKVIPSLTSEVKEGISLICHNSKVGREDAEFLENLLSSISTVKILEEKNFEIASDLTSCAPGLIAAIFNEFVNAGLKCSNLSRKEAEEMIVKTLLGTAKIFNGKKMSFDETITRVATKGGITEEGVKVLTSGLPAVFDEMFKQMVNKQNARKEQITADFDSN